MFSEHFSSFSNFMTILVLAEDVVGLFCILSGLIMLLLPRVLHGLIALQER